MNILYLHLFVNFAAKDNRKRKNYIFSLKNQVFTITITFLKRALTTPENLEKNRIKGSRYKTARAPLGGLSFTSNIFVYFWNSLIMITNEKFTSWITKKVWLKKRRKLVKTSSYWFILRQLRKPPTSNGTSGQRRKIITNIRNSRSNKGQKWFWFFDNQRRR